jgi:hypothetical protein
MEYEMERQRIENVLEIIEQEVARKILSDEETTMRVSSAQLFLRNFSYLETIPRDHPYRAARPIHDNFSYLEIIRAVLRVRAIS